MEGTTSEKPLSFCGLLREGRDDVRSHQTQHDPSNSLVCARQLLHSGTERVSRLPQVTQLQSLLRASPSVASLNLEDPFTFS